MHLRHLPKDDNTGWSDWHEFDSFSASVREGEFIAWLYEEVKRLESKQNHPSNTETCEHGLSAWLCEGPQHYPYC